MKRTSVHPYGKEVKVFSSPNCYLSKTECFSLFPAPVSQAKHLHSPRSLEKTRTGAKTTLSNLRTQSPDEEDLGCWSIRQASDGSLAFESLKSLRGSAPLILQEIKALSKGHTGGQQSPKHKPSSPPQFSKQPNLSWLSCFLPGNPNNRGSPLRADGHMLRGSGVTQAGSWVPVLPSMPLCSASQGCLLM